MASATCLTMGAPSISARSLFSSPMRRDMPAARITPPMAILSDRRCSTMRRGSGREAISMSRPPMAMSAISSSSSGRPARTSCKTQSNPFSRGERAHPGMPITGMPSRLADISRLPGSAGRPSLSTLPPACSTAIGTISRRSLMADAPQISSASAPCCRAASMAFATASASCATTRLSTSAQPSWLRRCLVTFSVLVSKDGFMPSIRVWINANGRGVSR